jgi:hypothetical protein
VQSDSLAIGMGLPMLQACEKLIINSAGNWRASIRTNVRAIKPRHHDVFDDSGHQQRILWIYSSVQAA